MHEMHVQDPKIIALKAALQDITRRHARPALMISWGKDSMALLWTLKILGEETLRKWTLLHCKDPHHPRKLRDVPAWIREAGLTVHDLMPAARLIHETPDGRLNAVARYRLEEALWLCVPRDVEEPLLSVPGQPLPSWGPPYLCLRDEWITGLPRAVHATGCDAYVIGHKDTDTDPVLGPIPLRADQVAAAPGIPCYFPLRHWSDDEVWAYTELYDIPRDVGRYEHPGDLSQNPDWMQACGRCLKRETREGVAAVPCPRHGWVPPVAAALVPTEATLAREYFGTTPPS